MTDFKVGDMVTLKDTSHGRVARIVRMWGIMAELDRPSFRFFAIHEIKIVHVEIIEE